MFSRMHPPNNRLSGQPVAAGPSTNYAVQTWQLEDALNALRSAEQNLATLEHRHSREKEELQLIIAAYEESAKQHQQKSKQSAEQLERMRLETEKRLDAAKQFVAKNKDSAQQQRAEVERERKELRDLIQQHGDKLQEQEFLISDLTNLCEQKSAELDAASRSIQSLEADKGRNSDALENQVKELQQQLAARDDQIQRSQVELERLRSECEKKESDLHEALQLCDEFEAKLIRSTDEYSLDRAGLEDSLSLLRGQSNENEKRVKELEIERQKLEEKYTVKLDDLSNEAKLKSDEAKLQYENQIGSLQVTIDDLEAKARQRAEEVEQLSSKIVTLNSDYADKFAAAHKRIQDEVTRSSSGHHEEINRLQSVIGSLETKIAAEAEVANTSKIEATNLRSQLQNLQDDSAKQAQAKAAKVSSLADTIRKSQERVKQQKLEEAKQLKVEVRELNEQLSSTRESGLRFKREARRLARRLSKTLSEHAKQREHFCGRIEELQRQIESAYHGEKRAA